MERDKSWRHNYTPQQTKIVSVLLSWEMLTDKWRFLKKSVLGTIMGRIRQTLCNNENVTLPY